MEKIFSKTFFPKAPGGDRYEWKMVETTFLISTKSLFAIKIVASAKNAQQNRSKDDDDLRVALDGFDFGKYEHHQDGDNLKVIVNGTSLKNPHAPTSYKYKNFYFSGDIKGFDVLTITPENLSDPFAFENAIELWYDEKPEISNLKIKYFNNEEFLERLKDFVDLKDYILNRAHLAINSFRISGKMYSARFLEHALETNPPSLIFEPTHPIARKIKTDPTYVKILQKLKENIADCNFDGEIWPEDFTNDEDMKGRINLSWNLCFLIFMILRMKMFHFFFPI